LRRSRFVLDELASERLRPRMFMPETAFVLEINEGIKSRLLEFYEQAL